METVRNLEHTIAKWYGPLPHLPKEVRKWLAENAWWLVLIGVIIGAMGVLSLLFFTVLAGGLLTAIAGGVGAVVGGLIMVGVLASLSLSIVAVFLGGLAVGPLKALRKKGWALVFIVLLLEVVAIVISNIFILNIVSMVWSLLWAAVGGYFLFETRDFFAEPHSKKTHAEKK